MRMLSDSKPLRVAAALLLLVLALLAVFACHGDESDLTPVVGMCLVAVVISTLVRPRIPTVTMLSRGTLTVRPRPPTVATGPALIVRPPPYIVLEVRQT